MDIVQGMRYEKTLVVEDSHIASHLGSGGVPVYATPAMVLHMEESSRMAVDPHLPPRHATVGSFIAVHHLAPTPKGMCVRIVAEVVKVEGRLITFKVEAYDEVELVGRADHVRAVVDLDRFGGKIARKLEEMRK